MFSKFIERIEDTDVPFFGGAFGFMGILAVRFFLENFSNPNPTLGFPAVPEVLTLLHYTLFFIGVFLSLSLVLRIFIPDLVKISKFLLFGFPIIWLPPVVDIIYSHGTGYAMAYIFADSGQLLHALLTLNGSSFFGSTTPGIRVEIICVLIGIFLYAITKTKSILRSVGATLCSYAVIFFWLALPSFIAILLGLFGMRLASSSPQYLLVANFYASHSVSNFIKPYIQVSYVYAAEIFFELGISYFYYILDFFLFIGWFFSYRPDIARSFLKNCRPERLGNYFLMILVGIFAASRSGGWIGSAGFIDVLGFSILIISYFCAWFFAVGTNDMADIDIDRIRNKSRPLVAKNISEENMRSTNLFFFAWSFVGAYLVGYWAFFMMLVFTAAYYIYSAPPLRLKRVPLLSTFLISLACLSTVMAGFYFVSPERLVSNFPTTLALIIIIGFTLGANIKDIKDIAGDRAAGIATVPVVFGEKTGRTIIGGLLAVSFLAIPIILASKILFVPSVAAAILGYFFVVTERYKEWKIFALYFVYTGVAMAVLWW